MQPYLNESTDAFLDESVALVDHEQLADKDYDLANAPRHRSDEVNVVSVLIPVFNDRWTIEAALRSVLNVEIDQEIEVIVVDDGSTDGSRAAILDFMETDDRIKLVCHPRRRGKGVAIRTAIEHLSGDVAIIQDAEMLYDPNELPKLLRPIVDGDADAVFGSRFSSEGRVLSFWRSLANRALTLMSNALTDLNLTDMETCLKVIRTDVLRELRLNANSFTIDPQLTSRLAQWGARIYEVPVRYTGHQVLSRTKGFHDGLKAIGEMFRCRFLDTRFTRHTGMYVLRSLQHAQNYNQFLVDCVHPFLGDRVAEAGAGIGNMSRLLANHEHVLLVDHDPIYVASLEETFQLRDNVRVAQTDLTTPGFETAWGNDKLDTVFCSNVLEHLAPHQEILQSFHNTLQPGGHCIIIVPAEPELYNGLDTSLGHHRRYEATGLKELMETAGFEVVHNQQVCRLGSLAWWVNGKVLCRRRLTPRQMLMFDRLWPIVRRFDHWLPWKGMSLIMVGKKSE